MFQFIATDATGYTTVQDTYAQDAEFAISEFKTFINDEYLVTSEENPGPHADHALGTVIAEYEVTTHNDDDGTDTATWQIVELGDAE